MSQSGVNTQTPIGSIIGSRGLRIFLKCSTWSDRAWVDFQLWTGTQGRYCIARPNRKTNVCTPARCYGLFRAPLLSCACFVFCFRLEGERWRSLKEPTHTQGEHGSVLEVSPHRKKVVCSIPGKWLFSKHRTTLSPNSRINFRLLTIMMTLHLH